MKEDAFKQLRHSEDLSCDRHVNGRNCYIGAVVLKAKRRVNSVLAYRSVHYSLRTSSSFPS